MPSTEQDEEARLAEERAFKTAPDNPRAGVGHNMPPLARSIAAEQGDFAAVTTAFLEEEYAKHPDVVEALLEECATLLRDPASGALREIADDDMKGRVVSLMKRLRDEAKALDAIHGKEKTPYLRGGQAVDQFFFGLIDKLARREKRNRPGAADVLQEKLTAYDTKLLHAEQERRRREAAEQERIAREAQEKAAREAREAEEARLAAERARKPEIIEQKGAAAASAEIRAGESHVEAQVAAGRAEEAHVATFAKPADLMRRRGDDGTLSTMATEPYAVVEDDSLLDKEKLWPFLSLDAKEKALRAWAKVTGYGQQMPGAKVGRKPKSVVR